MPASRTLATPGPDIFNPLYHSLDERRHVGESLKIFYETARYTNFLYFLFLKIKIAITLRLRAIYSTLSLTV